jgi:hypothetical protein
MTNAIIEEEVPKKILLPVSDSLKAIWIRSNADGVLSGTQKKMSFGVLSEYWLQVLVRPVEAKPAGLGVLILCSNRAKMTKTNRIDYKT